MPVHREPYEEFRRQAEALFSGALGELGADMPSPPSQQAPPGKGDFAFPCFAYGKALRQGPAEAASKIAQAIAPRALAPLPGTGSKEPAFSRISPEGPYVNFHANPALLASMTLESALALWDDYGTLPPKNRKVLLEHTSVNPTGPLHVGRARNPIVGDSLARILRRAGYDVATEYYVNDVGKQVAMLIWGVMNYKGKLPLPREKADHAYVQYYQAANSQIKAAGREAEEKIEDTLRKMEAGDPEVAREAALCTEPVIGGISVSLSSINISIDRYVRESSFVSSGAVKEIVTRLQGLPESAQEDGALFLELSSKGLQGEDTRFFYTRKDGTSLYTTRDIAYHLDKLSRCDIAINVLGEDQKRAMDKLKIALALLGSQKAPHTVYYSFVSLPEGRMSTRDGKVVYLDDLVEESVARAMEEVKKRRGGELSDAQMELIARSVGVGAIRFNIIRVQNEKQIVFKWEDALNFEGFSGPFIQYSHARACSILRKAEGEGAIPGGLSSGWKPAREMLASQSGSLASALNGPAESALVTTLARLPGVIADCAKAEKAHSLAQYAFEAAESFNQFYRDCPVLSAGPQARDARIALVLATKAVLCNSLGALGIDAPAEM